MYLTLVILILLVCFLMSLVVLAQNPKGGGISSQFGASGAANLMGVKRTGDLLEKLTWGFAIALIVLTLATHNVGQQHRRPRAQRESAGSPAGRGAHGPCRAGSWGLPLPALLPRRSQRSKPVLSF